MMKKPTTNDRRDEGLREQRRDGGIGSSGTNGKTRSLAPELRKRST